MATYGLLYVRIMCSSFSVNQLMKLLYIYIVQIINIIILF